MNFKEYFRKKFLEGYEGHEIVIALLALIKEKKADRTRYTIYIESCIYGK